MKNDAPFLSLVLPAHNEEQRLPASLKLVDDFIRSQPYSVEVVIVENASSDATLEMARRYASERVSVTVLHEERPGKGLAVQTGMLAAKGQHRFFCDVDFSMPIDQIPKFLPPQLNGVDIAIASREAKGAVRIGEPYYRHLIGRVFNLFVWVLNFKGIKDTQCGFKCFTAEAAEKLFPLQTIHGWTFDVEILALAKNYGFKIHEVPVTWTYGERSKVRVVRDFARTVLELIKIRRDHHK
jgi:glycosyltransferase involved in cell wall biosynthesis